jgi:hypothetical protein
MNERRPNDDYDGAGLLGKLLATVPHLRVGDEDRELAVLRLPILCQLAERL